MSKKTLVIGATPNPARYAYLATNMLLQHGHEVSLVGIKQGSIAGQAIQTDLPVVEDIHTVTLYVSPNHQQAYINYVLSLKPQRIIFNPGTENPAFEQQASEAGIQVEEACTLVMLSTGQY